MAMCSPWLSIAICLLCSPWNVGGLTLNRSGGRTTSAGVGADAKYISLPSGARLEVLELSGAPHPTPAVIVLPGGGYWGLRLPLEGEDAAHWANGIGAHSYVLEYRTRTPEDRSATWLPSLASAPIDDAHEALAIVRSRIAPHASVAMLGFSAGGHVALWSALVGAADPSLRPDAVILAYALVTADPSISPPGSFVGLLGHDDEGDEIARDSVSLEKLVGKADVPVPPMFIFQNEDDEILSIRHALALAGALSTPYELHIFPKGGHGVGIAKDTEEAVGQWTSLCCQWLMRLSADWAGLRC